MGETNPAPGVIATSPATRPDAVPSMLGFLACSHSANVQLTAAALAPGESLTHVHQTFHFQGPRAELDTIAQATLGISLERIVTALTP